VVAIPVGDEEVVAKKFFRVKESEGVAIRKKGKLFRGWEIVVEKEQGKPVPHTVLDPRSVFVSDSSKTLER